MSLAHIVFPSAGSLSVAVVAVFILILQFWFSTKGAEFRWCRWAAAVSFSTILYSVGIFLEYNAPEGPVNRFGGLLEWTAVIFLVHALYGFVFSRLNIPSRTYHLTAGGFHVLILTLLWSTNIFVSDHFVVRRFLILEKPFVEADLGPLGSMFMLYALFASINAVRIWIMRGRGREMGSRAYVWGASFWILLGAHDAAAAVGLPSVQYLMEYGFLGFSAALFYGMFSDYVRTSGALEQVNVALRKEMEARRRTEEAIRESEERYRELVEYAPAGICEIAIPEMIVTSVNDAICEYSGYTREELLSINLMDLLAEESKGLYFQRWQRILSGEEVPAQMELKARGKDGKEVWIQYASTISYEEGIPRRASVIVHDITARKEAEERGKSYTRSLEFLSATAETFADFPAEENIHEFIGLKLRELAGDSVVIINSYEKASDAVCVRALVGLGDKLDQVLGLIGGNPVGRCFKIQDRQGREELLKGRLVDGPPGLRELSFGAISEETCKAIERIIGLRRIYGCGFVYMGQLLGTAIILSHQESPFNDNASAEAFISQVSLALQRRAAEVALWKSEERYRSVVVNATEGILVAQQGIIKFANPGVLESTGYSEEELISQPLVRFIHPEDREAAANLHWKRLRGEATPGTYTFRVVTKEGDILWVEAHGVVIEWEGGPATLNFLADITDRKRIEEALQASEKRHRIVSELTSDFSGSYRVEPDGNIVSEWVWGAAKDITGFTAEEIDARGGWSSLVHSDDVPIALRHLETLFSGRPDTCELRIVTRNGAVRWLHNQARPERDGASGRVVRVYGASKDITERKQAEETLRESEERYRHLFEMTFDACLLVDEESLRIIDCNASATKLYGYSKEELVAMRPTDLSAEPEKTTEAIRKGIPFIPLRWQRRKDGTLFPVEIAKNRFVLHGRKVVVSAARDISIRVQAEDAMQKSEEQYRKLFEGALDGIALADPDTGVVLDCNDAFLRLVERERDEVVGKSQTILHPPEDHLGGLSRSFLEHKTSRQGQVIATQVITKSGERRDVEINANFNEIGRRTVMQGIFRDITERKRAEEALKQAEERYRSIFENAVEGIFQTTPDGRYLSANSALAKMHGYDSPEDLIASVSDIARQDYVNPEDRTSFVKALEEHGFVKGFVTEAHRKDGSRFWVSTNGRIVRGSDGGTLYYEGTIEDISEQRRMEEALLVSEEQYKRLFESALDGIVLFDPDTGIILDCNDSLLKLVEREKDEVIGKSQKILHPPEYHLDGLIRTFVEHKTSRQGQVIATKVITKTGKLKDVEINAHFTEIGNRKVLQSTFRDISDRIKAEREREEIQSQLYQSQKMETLGTLVAGVAHEVNNPINLIMFNVSLLQKIWRDLEPVLEQHASVEPDRTYGGLTLEFLNQDLVWLLQDMEMAANRVASITRGLKEFSMKSDVMEKKTMLLNEAVQNTLRLAQATLRKSGIKVSVNLAEDLPLMMGNVRAVEQVVLNLITNGIQAIKHDKGEIAVHTGMDRAEGRVYVAVRDNGKGIDPLISERIFDPFFTDRQAEGGTGLGLAVSYNLVKAHEGEITFESEVGKGTTFRVYFPAEGVKRPVRVLAVDDESSFLDAIRGALSMIPGCEVETAMNGTEALLRLASFFPDLLILDLRMPDMDGLEVCRILRRVPQFSELKVVVLTGFPGDLKPEDIKSLEISRVFSKPVGLHELVKQVEEMVGKSEG